MKEPLITDIQKYCIHDGHGIRTTVFFKGCPLSCGWCHNPETQSFSRQLLFDEDKCRGCGACIPACQSNAITLSKNKAVTNQQLCTVCGTCQEECLGNLRIPSGNYYTVEELQKELEKDLVFYTTSGGGVTLSGGEVLLQDTEYLEQLLSYLATKKISVNIDTCGHAPREVLQRLFPYVDTFLYDVKLMDPVLHKKFTGVDNRLLLDNLIWLNKQHARLWIRIPVIVGVNSTLAQMEQIAFFLKSNEIHPEQINLLPYHNTGRNKYNRLSRTYHDSDFETPTNDELERFFLLFQEYGFANVKIGG